ncbi:MAG: FAD:protein FMN transferase [Paracoccaceae bacterium]
MAKLTRRRFITISAAVAAMPGAAFAGLPVARWRGTALGAGASMVLAGVSQREAAPLLSRFQAELDRLEDIFSLYRPDSVLSRLNRDGRVDFPPAELLEVLSLSTTLHRLTDGAFDPTVQPLWSLYAAKAARGEFPDSASIAAARRLTGWESVRFDGTAIRFRREGMALTLNGIAQGYVSDRIADMLRTEGLKGVLVDMGEIHALGRRPDGKRWRVGIADPDGHVSPKRISLGDRAVATSAPAGTILDPDGRIGHILDPRTGFPGGLWRQVTVSAPRAALADGLSTAFCLMDRYRIGAALGGLRDTRLERILV